MSKKKLFTAPCLALAVLFFVSCMSSCGFNEFLYRVPKGESVVVDGTIVHNEFNNYLSGSDFCRIGDKLYFNFARTDQNNGLMEISKDGATRIYQKKNDFFSDAGYPNYPIFSNNGKLYMYMKEGYDILKLLSYNGEFKEKLKLDTEVFVHDIIPHLFAIDGDKIYFCAADKNHVGRLCCSENGKLTFLTDKDVDVCKFYFTADKRLFFSTYENKTGQIYKLDKDTGKATKIISDACSCYFFVDSNYIIMDDTVFDMNKPEKGAQKIDALSGYYHINVYAGKVYLAGENGLFVYDLKTRIKTKLVNANVKNAYIVDDKYVYYVKSNASLWRVSNDKTVNEHVYG